ncbi:syntaxin 1B/2/3 [Marchantia polymorpha subsp. ruderalis]|uniref:t-SNARE coiled-coil homology domain-containing protein n=2 Tax=Marchantia polymorpha TaxID=3197 RepID=A0AAF6BZ30_MARPO|nr:hypothetical protein MARPO_0009s0005 [Marchantia polymorpha]BAS01260.1 syntaxin of plant 13A [Marchantia polymorpha]BBN17264.1 hypothetical protein Mp_7g13190 [Marchantia polymorpha subsp. ruderalis]|eukprot:PTQ46869.1 hypothetical protein MARPO_0009s0005 [Marchantia polymorpha]
MNDLLGESGRHSTSAQDVTGNGREKNGKDNNDLEAGPSGTPDGGADMLQFFNEVGVIKTDMAQIRKNLAKLQDAHEETKTVTNAKAMKALKERMEKDIDEVSKVAQHIKGKIEALDKSNIANRKKPNCGEGSSTDRTRMSMTATLKKKLKELMTEFQALRQKFTDEYREVVERRVFTVTGQKADEGTIDQLIETGDSEQIFQKAIQEQGRGQILDTIAEIQERHDAVKDIEKKLLELHQIFLDMAVLVEAQGELLDNIETQVSKAVTYVQEGTVALQTAKKLQRGTRKCMCIAIILLLIIIIIIVVAVVQPWKTNKA